MNVEFEGEEALTNPRLPPIMLRWLNRPTRHPQPRNRHHYLPFLELKIILYFLVFYIDFCNFIPSDILLDYKTDLCDKDNLILVQV